MVRRVHPYCRCENYCGREAFVSRPCSHLGPTSTEVYAAVFEFYSRDRAVLDADSSYLVQDLFSLGYLNSMPSPIDVGHAQELIRDVER
jgi:hypothetical protein